MDKFLAQFLEVANLKNVSHAARKLCLTQPALTHNMKKLEETYGVPLFTRTSNGVNLTSFGSFLFEQAKIIQRMYDNTRIKIEAMRERSENGVRIGSGHAWWFLFMREIMGEYRRRHPSADIVVDIGNHLREMDLLLSGDISMFLGHEIVGLNRRAGVVFRSLFQVHDSFFARPGHPLAGGKCSIGDIFQYPMVELTPDEVRHAHVVEDPLPKQVERTRSHLNERIVFQSNSIMACMDLVLESDGILPFTVCMGGYFRRYGVVALELDERFGKSIVGIYMTEEAERDPGVSEILALIDERREALQSVACGGSID